MQISSRFTIAIHVLTCIDTFQDEYKVTSDFLAGSVSVNPVVIRRLLQQLKAAGIVKVTRGSGGAEIAKPLSEITMFDVYKAVDSVGHGDLFHFHENPNKECPVGRNIHNVLDDKLNQIQNAMENTMKSITIQEIVEETKCYIQNES
ncbi:MAG: Rrf2 family transcriptional regulator [Hespellia sp.]|nr:Rrf2 family transcriptional regulator [Hespellia sp.]